MSHGAAGGADLLISHIGQLVEPVPPAGPRPASGPLDVTPDAWLWIRGGRVAGSGAMAELPARVAGDPALAAAPRLNAGGGVALPGLVDSHTHAVFGATREGEFARRMAGATYQEIAAGGGGIRFSVRDLRARSEDELVDLTRPRLAACAAHGVTTVEVKSGYGLTLADERKALTAVQRLASEASLPRLVPTFLGAHAVPPEFAADRAGYVRLVCEEMLPSIAEDGLAAFCDVFCDEGAFTLAESERILERAAGLGLGLKIHAEEFAPLGGAALAVRLGAASADHLIVLDPDGVTALAGSGTVATCLPGTSFFLRSRRHAPARALADAGATLALATDFNPGTSMTQNLLLVATLGCCLLGLTIEEALRAVTWGGARALRADDRGTLVNGARGDVALFAVPDYRHLVYHYGASHGLATIRGGRVIWSLAGSA